MKVLFLARRFYPEIGGVERHVLEVSKRLTAKGHKIIVISEWPQESHSDGYHSNSPSAKSVGKLKNIESYNIDPGKSDRFKKFKIWMQLWKYRNLIKQADVVHCHDVFFWYLPFKFIFPKKPVFTTFHGYEGNNLPTSRAIFMHKLAEKLSFGNICVGDFLKKWYGTKPTYVTYGAVESKLIEQDKKYGEAKKDAIFIGRLEKETGILEYLKAISMLDKNKVDITLDVFGDGALIKEAKAYVAKNKLKVDFKGFVPNVTDYIKEYKYVFTSRYLGILEALALKKPVFAEYNNAIKKDYLEMAPFANFISISKNGEEISKNFEDYINEENKIDVEKGYDWVKTETWDKMAEVYLKLWSNQ